MDISTDNSVEFTQGEHVAAVWLDEENGQLQWYLGNILNIITDYLKTFHNVTLCMIEINVNIICFSNSIDFKMLLL